MSLEDLKKLKVTDLKKKAKALSMSENAINETDDAENIKNALIDLLLYHKRELKDHDSFFNCARLMVQSSTFDCSLFY